MSISRSSLQLAPSPSTALLSFVVFSRFLLCCPLLLPASSLVEGGIWQAITSGQVPSTYLCRPWLVLCMYHYCEEMALTLGSISRLSLAVTRSVHAHTIICTWQILDSPRPRAGSLPHLLRTNEHQRASTSMPYRQLLDFECAVRAINLIKHALYGVEKRRQQHHTNREHRLGRS